MDITLCFIRLMTKQGVKLRTETIQQAEENSLKNIVISMTRLLKTKANTDSHQATELPVRSDHQ